MDGAARAAVTSEAVVCPLDDGEIALWMCDPAAVADRVRERWHGSWLDDDERRRADAAGTAARRAEIILGRALLRASLAARAGRRPEDWHFVTAREGRPELEPELATGDASGVTFSLAHTRGLAICALARGMTVGADVERVDRRVDAVAIAERFFSRADAQAVANAPDHARRRVFLERWTLREAYAKVLGTPLLALARESVCFERVGIGPCAEIRLAAGSERATESWRFWMLAPTREHVVAVAARTLGRLAEPRLSLRYWSPSARIG